ncbi:MAG: hypothetical protein MZU95_09465 [Desulfomicrobium escambiense]|nr:hypothetical protein [Desulfomicrobium escambiense]
MKRKPSVTGTSTRSRCDWDARRSSRSWLTTPGTLQPGLDKLEYGIGKTSMLIGQRCSARSRLGNGIVGSRSAPSLVALQYHVESEHAKRSTNNATARVLD